MEERRISRPWPAILVAVLALVAALAGTALAGTEATTSAINKKKVKKIAGKQINKLAPGLSVAEAVRADTAANASNAANLGGSPPSAFAPARVIRSATVNANGTVDSDESDGIGSANISKRGTGGYCINGLSPAPRGISATVDVDTSVVGDQIFGGIKPAGQLAGCQAGVLTLNGADSVNRTFLILIH